jgi:hypothetical protein
MENNVLITFEIWKVLKFTKRPKVSLEDKMDGRAVKDICFFLCH